MLNKIFSKDYFSERALLFLTGTALLIASGITFQVMTTVKQYDYKIATGYTQYGADSFKLGEWYSLYEFAAFAVITTVAAVFISAKVLKLDRSLAYAAIILQHVVLVFLFVVSSALLGASSIAT